VIETLLEKCDKLLLGGMIFTFYKARGIGVIKSLVEEMQVRTSEVWAKAKERGVDLLLPTDVVVADKFAADANAQQSVLTISPR